MTTRLIALLSCAALMSGCGLFGSGPSPRTTTAPMPRSAAPSSFSIEIGNEHIRLIRDYYDYGSEGRGRGRGNRGLPPGVAKNLARGKPLPPGIAMQTLPQEIVAQLPRLPSGYEYAVAAGKLLLIDIATHVVHDVLVDALFG